MLAGGVPRSSASSATSYALLQGLRAQLIDGLPLRMVALGGSSTSGHVLSRSSPLLYFSRLASWINESHPHAETLVVNSGTPASGPTYMEKRFYRVRRKLAPGGGRITCNSPGMRRRRLL